MKKVILRSQKPFATFRGAIRKEDGKDKFGNTTYGAAKTYQFDSHKRYEVANTQDNPNNVETVLDDLKRFIELGKIFVLQANEVDDKIEIQDMKKPELIKELERLDVHEIDGNPLDRVKKEVLLAFLEEMYYQKSVEG